MFQEGNHEVAVPSWLGRDKPQGNTYQGGRGHWAKYYTSPKVYNNVFLFVGLTTLVTFVEF